MCWGATIENSVSYLYKRTHSTWTYSVSTPSHKDAPKALGMVLHVYTASDVYQGVAWTAQIDVSVSTREFLSKIINLNLAPLNKLLSTWSMRDGPQSTILLHVALGNPHKTFTRFSSISYTISTKMSSNRCNRVTPSKKIEIAREMCIGVLIPAFTLNSLTTKSVDKRFQISKIRQLSFCVSRTIIQSSWHGKEYRLRNYRNLE